MAKAKRKQAPYDPNVRAPAESLRHALSHRIGTDGSQHVVRDHVDHYRARGFLDPRDDRRNEILWQAADKYRTVHFQAGLTGLSAIDYGREGRGDGDPAYAMPTTEHAMMQRVVFRNARAAVRKDLGTIYASVVDAVVIDGDSIEDAAPVSSTSKETRRQFGMEFLRVGLDALARHWGMLGNGHRSA